MLAVFVLAPRVNFAVVAQGERCVACGLDLDDFVVVTRSWEDLHRLVNICVLFGLFLMIWFLRVSKTDLPVSIIAPGKNFAVRRKRKHVVVTGLNALEPQIARELHGKCTIARAPASSGASAQCTE